MDFEVPMAPKTMPNESKCSKNLKKGAARKEKRKKSASRRVRGTKKSGPENPKEYYSPWGKVGGVLGYSCLTSPTVGFGGFGALEAAKVL